MAAVLEIQGGRPLRGRVPLSGAKNAALPMLIASLLSAEEVVLRRVPNLEDVNLTLRLLEHFGARVSYDADTARIRVPNLVATEASYSLVKALRASFWVLAPLLARGGAARVALPGGDVIGARPVDMHLEALTKMGAEIRLKHGVVYATAPQGLHAEHLTLRFPSVGATHQVLMAAALTPGCTVLEGAAREPEVVALAGLLTAMGAEIRGAGTARIEIEGRRALGGAEIDLIGDRIEAGTYLLAGVATRGAVQVDGINPETLVAFLQVLRDMGVHVQTSPDSIAIRVDGPLRRVRVVTGPHPEFPTDLQAPLLAALTLVAGESVVEETVFEGRFSHVAELGRMGARMTVEDRIVRVTGVSLLTGAPVEGFDIRAAAALVIAGLAAEGRTFLHEAHHLRRGYEGLEQKLRALGADVREATVDEEDYVGIGC